MAPATAATATSIKKRFIFPPSGPPLHARECPDSTSPLQPCQISRQDDVWSPLMKKEAKDPATAVTTLLPQHRLGGLARVLFHCAAALAGCLLCLALERLARALRFRLAAARRITGLGLRLARDLVRLPLQPLRPISHHQYLL